MRKITFVAAVLSFLCGQALCLADPNEPNAAGFRGRAPRSGGMYRSERVVINWHNGIQQMVVSPRVTPEANSLWIFPLKCKSEQVKYSLAKSFPELNGSDPRETAERVLTHANYAVIAGQLWTLPLYYFRNENTDYNSGPAAPGTVDSNGVHIELLTADSVPALAAQLKERGRTVPDTQLEPYAGYLNKACSFVVVWREGNEPNAVRSGFGRGFRRRTCVYMEFPSEKPFYPLIQKSGRQGRLSLTLTGFWQPAGQDRSNVFQCSQLISQDVSVPDFFRSSLPDKDIPFTMISTFGPGSPPQNDLELVPGRLDGMAYADTVSKMSCPALVPLGLIALAVVSYLSAGVSGLLIYRKWRGFAALGFLNVLTILAVSIAMNYQKSSTGEAFRQDKRKARWFLAVFSVLVVALSFGLFALLKIPLQ